MPPSGPPDPLATRHAPRVNSHLGFLFQAASTASRQLACSAARALRRLSVRGCSLWEGAHAAGRHRAPKLREGAGPTARPASLRPAPCCAGGAGQRGAPRPRPSPRPPSSHPPQPPPWLSTVPVRPHAGCRSHLEPSPASLFTALPPPHLLSQAPRTNPTPPGASSPTSRSVPLRPGPHTAPALVTFYLGVRSPVLGHPGTPARECSGHTAGARHALPGE